jgi:hypothetical protein
LQLHVSSGASTFHRGSIARVGLAHCALVGSPLQLDGARLLVSMDDLFQELFGPRSFTASVRRAPIDEKRCLRDTAVAVLPRSEPHAPAVADALVKASADFLLIGDSRVVSAHLAVTPAALRLVREHLALVRAELRAVVARSAYSLNEVSASATVTEPTAPEPPPRAMRRGELVDSIARTIQAEVKAYEVAEQQVRLRTSEAGWEIRARASRLCGTGSCLTCCSGRW